MSERYTAKDARLAFARLSARLDKTWSDDHGNLWKGSYWKPEAAGELWSDRGAGNQAETGAWHLDSAK